MVTTQTNSERVWVVSTDSRLAQQVRAALDEPSVEVRACADVDSFVEAYEPVPPECLLAEHEQGSGNGPELQELLEDLGLGIPLVLTSSQPSIEMVVAAMRRGASDFLVKPLRHDRLGDSLRRALSWSALHETELRRSREASALLERLTAREQEVLRLVLEGLPSKRIATALGVSPKTVDVHRAHIGQKLGAESLAELIRLGLEAERLESLERLCGFTRPQSSALGAQVRRWAEGDRSAFRTVPRSQPDSAPAMQ